MTDETAPDEATTVAEPSAAAATPRKGVFVPRWLMILLGIVVAVGLVGGGGFALGRSSAGDDHHGRSEDRRDGPSGLPSPGDHDGRGDGGGPGGSPTPSRPTPPSPISRVLLGVAVARDSGTDGARVVEVVPGSPAADAGLEVGDVITAVDGSTIADGSELAAAIQDHDPGDTVTITYGRGGSSSTARVELGEQAQSGAQSGPTPTSPPA